MLLDPLPSELSRGGTRVAHSYPVNKRKRGKHHPRFSDNLAPKELKTAEGEPKENYAVDYEPDRAACNDGSYKTPPLQRGVD